MTLDLSSHNVKRLFSVFLNEKMRSNHILKEKFVVNSESSDKTVQRYLSGNLPKTIPRDRYIKLLEALETNDAEFESFVSANQQGDEQPDKKHQDSDQAADDIIEHFRRSKYWPAIPAVLHSVPPAYVDKVYVELRLTAENTENKLEIPDTTTPEADFDNPKISTHFIHVDSLLSRLYSRAVVIGPPGSGKSTLIKKVFVYLLNDTDKQSIPLPIRLKAYAQALTQSQDISLLTFCCQQMGRADFSNRLGRLMKDTSAKQQVTFLLDGWDEIPINMRTRIRSIIDAECEKIPTIITSRPSGIPELLRDGQTLFYELGPLTDHSISELCRNYGETRKNIPLVNELLSFLENTPSLWSMASNPYLLTLLCEVVFNYGSLPEYRLLSPHWIIQQAADLIVKDHNLNTSDDVISDRDVKHLKTLSYCLSFSKPHKLLTFDSAFFEEFTHSKISHSPLKISRFFKGSNTLDGNPIYEFSHLRLQEYFAAEGFLEHSDFDKPNDLDQLIYSAIHHEEICHLAAETTPESHAYFWSKIGSLATHPDLGGETLRRLAYIFSTAGIRDGGEDYLNLDVRELLWNRILHPKELFLKENISSLVNLDINFLVDKTESFISAITEDDSDACLQMESIYRALPFEIRKNRLDRLLKENRHFSFLVGIPSVKSFPSLGTLDGIVSIATDPGQPTQDRVYVLREIGALRAIRSVERIIPLMEDEDADVALAAIEALGKIGGKSVALAMAKLLISERYRQVDIGWALLNALSLNGRGVLEPYSVNLILNAIEKISNDDDNIGLLLGVLEDIPLTNPPACIMSLIIGDKNINPGASKAAVNLVKSIRNDKILSTCLDLVEDCSLSAKMSRKLIGVVPYIPINYRSVFSIWSSFTELDTYSKEKKLYLSLFIRTIRAFPNHPLSHYLIPWMENSLDELIEHKTATFHKEILSCAFLVIRSRKNQQRFTTIAFDDSFSEKLRSKAIKSLAEDPLSTSAELDKFFELFTHIVTQQPKDKVSLIEALTNILFLARPSSAPSIIRAAEKGGKSYAEFVNRSVLCLSRRLGFLIFYNRVVSPEGVILPR